MITNKKLLVLAISSLFGTANLYACSTNDFINQARLRHEKIIRAISKNNANFLKLKEDSVKKANEYRITVETIKNKHQAESKISREINKRNKSEQAIVFVSFSMPDLSLKQIIHDATYYQIPVVIRGLYKNSFRETVNKIFELVKEDNKSGIAINPKWFKEYDIKTVPAVVVISSYRTNKNKENRRNKISDVVYGNIPIKRALSIITERGAASNVALDILSRVD